MGSSNGEVTDRRREIPNDILRGTTITHASSPGGGQSFDDEEDPQIQGPVEQGKVQSPKMVVGVPKVQQPEEARKEFQPGNKRLGPQWKGQDKDQLRDESAPAPASTESNHMKLEVKKRQS